MIKTGHDFLDLPIVNWQGEASDAFLLFELKDRQNHKPSDGHDPEIPHRIGFHALFLVTDGGFDHWMDFQTHRLRKNHLVYIAPNQIHHFVRSKEAKNALVLIFRPELLPGDLPGKVANRNVTWSVLSYLWPSLTMLESQETRLLEEQMRLIGKLKSEFPVPHSAAIKHHVCGFITAAFELATRNNSEITVGKSNERLLQFIQLSEEQYKVRRDVKWYATQLQCTERTLNRTCQQSTGQSAKTILTTRVVVEAKRILSYSSDSVSIIAESLGFGESTNFVRFFKKETGMTPQAFRKLIEQKS